MNAYRVHISSGALGHDINSVLVVADTMAEAEAAVMRDGEWWSWSTDRRVDKIELVPGEVLIASSVSMFRKE